MNRREAIDLVRDCIRNSDIDECDLEDLLEYLEKEITLAEFLGWEEGKEYDLGIYDGGICRVKDGRLEQSIGNEEWCNVRLSLTPAQIRKLRQATPVKEKPKAYHVTDKYSYDCLMKELEEKGLMWTGGIKPTERKFELVYGKAKEVIYVNESNCLAYSSLEFYKSDEKNNYDLIEYHKEEPKFRARIKEELNIPLTARDYYFVKASKEIKTTKSAKNLNTREAMFIMTKTEWNKLGINDTNADFEEVE